MELILGSQRKLTADSIVMHLPRQPLRISVFDQDQKPKPTASFEYVDCQQGTRDDTATGVHWGGESCTEPARLGRCFLTSLFKYLAKFCLSTHHHNKKEQLKNKKQAKSPTLQEAATASCIQLHIYFQPRSLKHVQLMFLIGAIHSHRTFPSQTPTL